MTALLIGILVFSVLAQFFHGQLFARYCLAGISVLAAIGGFIQ